MYRMLLSTAALLTLAAGVHAKQLSVGDAAPPLKIDQWVKGDSFDITKGDRVYVVEFWATWCGPCRMTIPHLSKMQDYFSKSGKVAIVGVSDEDADVVKPFVKAWDKKMRYAVAVDNDSTTTKAYLKAAGVN